MIAEDAGEQIIQLDDISALDSNSQVIAVSAVSGDSSLILQPIVEFTPGSSSATLKFRPEQDAHGSTQMMVITTDDQGNQVTSTIPVLVQSVNDPPVAIDDTFYINESSDLAAVNVFAANSSSADHDPDGQPFVVSAVQGGRVGTLFILTSGALLTIDSNGDLNYDPHQQFESLAENESATDSFTYTISDTDGATSVATVTVVISGENDAPVVSNSIVMTYSEDDAVDSLNLLSDASDPDVSDSLGISNLVWSGDAGGVSVNGTTLTVDPGYFNALSLGETAVLSGTYEVVDSQGAAVAQSVTLTFEGANDAPVAGDAIAVNYSEDDAVGTLDLLRDASDPDTSDSLGISNLVWSGDAGGVSVNGTTLTVDPGYFNDLAAGETAVLSGTYDVVDPQGGVVAQSVTLTFEGQNDAPVVSDSIAVTYSEDDAVGSLDLLEHASDPDTGDSLGIGNLVWSGDAGGVSVNGTTLTVDPGYFNRLAAGVSAVLTGTYDVVDAHGVSVTQSVTLTFEGHNDAPVVSDSIAVSYSEDDQPVSIDLLSQVSDPDSGDLLSITNLIWNGNAGGATLSGTMLNINPGYYNGLAAGTSETVSGSFDISDGKGGTVSQTVTFSIAGANDDPSVVDSINITFAEDAPVATVDLLVGSSDPDAGEVLAIRNLTWSGNAGGIVVEGTELQVDPGYYDYLIQDATEVITGSYEIIDSAGSAVSQTISLTITGLTDPAEIFGQIVVTDQVLDYHDTVSFSLTGAATFLGSVTAASTNQEIISDQDISLTWEGGDLRVGINHQSDDYGLSVIRLFSDGEVVHEFSVIVLPPETVTQQQAGSLNLGFDFEEIPAEGASADEELDPTTIINVSYNDRALAYLVAHGHVSTGDAMRLANPVRRRSYYDSSELEGISLETLHSPAGDTGTERQTTQRQTIYGGISENVEGGGSGTGEPDEFDKFAQVVQQASNITKVIESTEKDPIDKLAKVYLVPSVGVIVKQVFIAVDKIIDAADKDNNIDLSASGELVGGVTDLTIEMCELAIAISVKKNPVKTAFQTVQFISAATNLTNTVRHMIDSAQTGKVVEAALESPNQVVEESVRLVAELGEKTGLNELMTKSSATRDLGNNLKGYVAGSAESGDVLAAGAQTYQKVAVAKEYIDTTTQIAEHIEDIWNELFGPDDLYIDKDGIERSWSADQTRGLTQGRNHENVTTGSGNDKVITGSGNDKVETNAGDDNVNVKEGDNRVDTGSGNDIVRDGSGDSFIRTGKGADFVEDLGGNDRIDLGKGIDELVYPTRNIGRDLLFDSGRSGTIRLQAVERNEISLLKQGDDLTISVADTGGLLNDQIRIVDFFRNHETDWTVVTQDGTPLDLRRETGQIRYEHAAELALRTYSDISTYKDSLPADLAHYKTIKDPISGLHAEVFVHQSEVGQAPTQIYVSIQGTFFLDVRDLVADLTAGRYQATALINALDAEFTPEQLKSITFFGQSLGGPVGQWAGVHYAAHNVPFVNVITLNSPEISGLIETVIRDKNPGFSPGFENLSTTHIVDLNDYISKIGWWSGDGLGTSTWVTWEHPEHRPGGIPVISDLLQTHTPPITDFTEGEVEFTVLTPEAVQKHLRFESVEDTTHGLIRVNELTSATLSFFEILFPDQTLDFESIQTQNETWDSDYVDRLSPENLTLATYSRKFDFGTTQSNLAQGYERVTDQTLYVPGQALYGWEQITDDMNAVDRGRATSENRDFVATQGNTFIVDLSGSGIDLSQPRTYNVSFTTGDRDQLRESMVYYVNGFHYETIVTMPGQFLTHGMQLTTSDSKLTFTIKDRGGNSAKAIINSLSIELVAFGSPAPETTVIRDDPSVVVLTHGYTIPSGVAAIADVIKETVKETIAAAKDVYAVASAFKRGGKVLAILKATEITLRRVKEALEKDDDSVRANSRVHDWVFDAAESFATMSQRFRLGKLDANVIPVEFDKVLDAINAGKSGEQLLKYWKGSRDFLALDWTDESSDGSGIFEINDFDEIAHRNAVETGAFIYHKLLQAWIDKLQGDDPELKLDVLLVSHSYGYNVNRKLAERLSYHKIADDIDYLKVVALDPVSMKPDELVGAKRESDRLNWYHPELTPEVDAVTNYYQTKGVFHTKFTSVALAGGQIGAAIHELAGRIEDQIVFGRPLDGREGGGSAGFYNRQARIFDLDSLDEILRFRHWDPNEVELSSAELTDIEFSRDGSLVAASGKDGIVTVRYVDDVSAEDWDQPGNPPVAGDVKFVVWGQEAIVRSLAFVEMEVDGEWKEFLLTISAARNSENTDIDKNKVLLTDVETGLPVWQGRDIQGTQVEASPSGKTIVSTDANGNAKIWIRDDESLTFEKHGDIVEAHPGQGGAYITDVYVINDKYFVTAGGPTKRVKLFEITDDGAKQVDVVPFDNPGEGKVRNLDYDPYNGILAVAAGQQLSLWKLDRELGKLVSLSAEASSSHEKFVIADHVGAIQGIAFSKPDFLLDEQGGYHGDRVITLDGQEYEIERHPEGDIDVEKLSALLAAHGKNSLTGLQLVTGGEDRTVFRYALDRLDIGSVQEETVISGAMLPIREIALSPDGSRVAIVGQDNTDSDYGGPVKDIDVTSMIDKRLGFSLSELFIGGLREHNEVPKYYLEDVLSTEGESYFWQRNNEAASRPGDLPKDRNLALPPNKRDNKPDVDVAPIELYVRPGKEVVIKPLQYLLEVDRTDYTSTNTIDDVTVVYDKDDNAVGEIRNKKSGGKTLPNVFIFQAYDETDGLDFSDPARREYVGLFNWDYAGLFNSEGEQRTGSAVIKFRIINHQPIAYTDVIELHPGRSVTDFRPRKNDYDFDNDDFGLIPFPAEKQDLIYVLESGQQYTVGTVRRTPGNPAGSGIDIDVTISHEDLEDLLILVGQDSITVEISYQVQEKKYKAISEGTIKVQLQLQSGPTDVYKSELGADQVRINWQPVSWNADKYVIQQYDSQLMDWVKYAEVQGKNADSKLVALDPDVDEYWFRVVAVNEYRRHASYEGDGPGGLQVVPPEYVSPSHVVMEVQAPGKVEVAWDKVFWNAGKYLIDLYEVVENENGELITVPGDQQYEFNPEFNKHKEVDAGESASVVFKNLTPARTYFAKVTAKRGDLEFSKYADYPVTTSNKEIPGGINIVNLGPRKVKVSWATVGYAEKYRVVAMDPMQPLDANRIVEVTGAGSGNAHSAVLSGLSPDTSYVVIVEAKDNKSGDWVSVASLDYPPVVITNEDAQGTGSPVEVDGVGTTEFILLQDFDSTLRLPSTEGLFVETQFSIVNLSNHEFTVESADGRNINFLGEESNSHTFTPAIAARAIDSEDRAGGGIIVYHFVTIDPLDNGTVIWKIESGDNTSKARLIQTPEFHAIEEGSFEVDSVQSFPKRPVIVWNTPFWQVDRHKLQVFEVVLDGEDQPVRDANGNYLLGREIEDQRVNKQVDSSSPVERSHQFKGLSAGTSYVVRITTFGERTVSEEFLMETTSQQSPTNVLYRDLTLNGFTATWTEVKWNVQQYRVSFAEVGANGEVDESTREYRYVNNDKSSKVIDGLKSGVMYQFTVEARTADPDAETEWIANTSENITTVTILSADKLSISGLKLEAAHNRQLDLSWTALGFTPESLYFEYAPPGSGNWVAVPGGTVNNVSTTTKTLEGLGLNTSYDIQLVATVTDSAGTTHHIRSNQITESTEWSIIDLDRITETEVRVQFPRVATSTKYDIFVYLAGDDTPYQSKTGLDDGPADPRFTNVELLKPDTAYEIEVVARDGSTVLGTTQRKGFSTTPMSVVTGLTTANPTEYSVDVSWDPLNWTPDNQYLEVKRSDSDDWTAISRISIGKSQTSITVTNLDNNVSYDFRHVVAVNTKTGEETRNSSVESETTGHAVLNLTNVTVTGKRRMFVEWQEITYPASRLEIQVLQVDENDNPINGEDWHKASSGGTITDVSRTSKEISELVPGAHYRVRVVAFSDTFQNPVISNELSRTTEAFPVITGLDVSNRKIDGATVEWTRLETLDNDAHVTKNVIEVYLNGSLVSDSDEAGAGSGAKQSLKISGLASATQYEFKVVSYNGDIKLSESALYEFTTLFNGVSVDEESPYSAQANWPQFAGSSATDYRIRVLEPGTDNVISEKTVNIGSGFRKSTIDGLTPDTPYEMLVEVLKNQTVLSFSNRAAFRTTPAGLSGVNVSEVRRFSMDIGWNSVSEWANWTKVQWRKAGTSSWNGSGSLSGTRTAYSITGLQNNTQYEIKVSAGGNGLNYEVSLTKTTPDFVKPSAPGFTDVQTRQLTINWTHNDPAGAPDSYAILRNGQKIAEVGSNVRSYTDTGLTSGTSYTYMIRAKYALKNIDGTSATRSTLAVNHVAATITGISNVRSKKVDISWSFAGDISEVEKFTIHRNNSSKDQLSLTNPANYPGQTSFKKEIDRNADARWWIFVRVRFKDGTIVDSVLIQLP
ncbi:fibronectin type III domain-containing protein [Gimesia panareensis]|uniref:fibronectin type III domain-containing protein n=1 Tax=Gimesia panareensis TaxID=2527978 RepID=UPI001E4DDC92|nr:cadherin-like domain-containing protein [Gimesia panareensis]